MRRWIAVVPLATLLITVVQALAATPEVVRDEPGIAEHRPSRSEGYLVWSEFSLEDFRTHSQVMADGGEPVRINPIGTQSGTAMIDGTTVAYAEEERGGSDIRFYDPVTQDRSDPPDGVNTDARETSPALSGDWLLFRRVNSNLVRFRNTVVKLILVNLVTGERRKLVDSQHDRRFVTTGQVNGDWLTYESCRFRDFDFENCQQFLYQISTETKTKTPNPGVQQYAGGVTTDGTVYLVRSGGPRRWTCGDNARIVRVPLGGQDEVIARLPDGIDALSAFAFEDAYDSVTYYIARGSCRTGDEGIYAIRNADTATMSDADRVGSSGATSSRGDRIALERSAP